MTGRSIRMLAGALALVASAAPAAHAGTLARTARPVRGIAVDGRVAYVTDKRGVLAVPTGGGHVRVVCRTCGGIGIAARDGAIAVQDSFSSFQDYWHDTGALLRITSTGATQLLATAGESTDEPLQSSFGPVVVGGGRIAWDETGVTGCDPSDPDTPDCEDYGGLWYTDYAYHRVDHPAGILDGTALAIAADGRILLADGRLLKADGTTLLRTIALPAGTVAALFDGDAIVLRTGAGVATADATTGAVGPARALGRSAELLDARGGLVLVQGGRRLVVIRRADGRSAAVVAVPRGTRLVGGGLSPDGVAYAADRAGRGAVALVPAARVSSLLG